MAVAIAAIAAPQELDAVAFHAQIGEQGFPVLIQYLGTDRHWHDQVFALFAAAVAAHAVFAALGLEMLAVAEVDQGIEGRDRLEDNMATTPAITTGRTAARDIFLTPERDGAVATIAGF